MQTRIIDTDDVTWSYLGALSYLAVHSLCSPVCLSVLAKCLDLSISLFTDQSLQGEFENETKLELISVKVGKVRYSFHF